MKSAQFEGKQEACSEEGKISSSFRDKSRRKVQILAGRTEGFASQGLRIRNRRNTLHVEEEAHHSIDPRTAECAVFTGVATFECFVKGDGVAALLVEIWHESPF